MRRAHSFRQNSSTSISPAPSSSTALQRSVLLLLLVLLTMRNLLPRSFVVRRLPSETFGIGLIELYIFGVQDTEPLVYSQGSKTILTIPIPNFSVQAVYDPVLSPVPRSESANGAALASVTAATLAAAAVAAAL